MAPASQLLSVCAFSLLTDAPVLLKAGAGLGWAPADSAKFSQAMAGPSILTQRCFTGKYLQQLGNKSAFELGVLAGAAGYALVGFTCRPLGASKLRKTLQFAAVLTVLINSFVGASSIALQSMFVKHGCSVADVGKGEINSAFSGIGTLVGTAMPMFWAAAFSFFTRPPRWLPQPLHLGPSGPFLLASAMLVLSRVLLRSGCHYRKLYVVENQIPAHRLSDKTLAEVRRELRMASVADNKFQKGTPMWLFRRHGRSLLLKHDLALPPSATHDSPTSAGR
eukprot:SAG22_NODE_16_length_32723_cov_26.404825_25_plen_279_part_00